MRGELRFMKTKKLIELLQLEDPTGEREVCVGNVDIFHVERKPAYWDGCLQVLERDWDCKFYNVIGAKYTSKGDKVNIETLSIREALVGEAGFPVVVEDTFVNKRMQETVDRWRKEALAVDREIEKRTKKNED